MGLAGEKGAGLVAAGPLSSKRANRRGRQRCAPPWRPLLCEPLEQRQMLSYIALKDTPLVVGYSGYANGTVLKAPLHGSVELRSEGGFTYVPTTGYTGDDRIAIGVGSGAYDFTVFVAPP